MADNTILRAIEEKCDIFYDDALLSKERIIEKYLKFFASQFDPTTRSVSFAFHTGSLCFDVVSIAAIAIGCLAYEYSTNDEILSALNKDDMVLFRGERYRWGGVEYFSIHPDAPKIECVVLWQDAKGKNGPTSLRMPFNKCKHLIKPYLGTSSVTDGRGIRKTKSNRNDFISYILDIPPEDVPAALDLAVVVVADKNVFIEICKHLIIRYKEDRSVRLTDIVPVSYYTSNGERFQIEKNASKSEAVLKVTCNMSMARNLVLDRNGNTVIGLLVQNSETLDINSAELNDLLRRRSLKFAYVTTPFNSDSCTFAMEKYESAKMFACTKALLSDSDYEVRSPNKLTNELNRQITNILVHKTNTITIKGFCSWNQYKKIKEKLYTVKQSQWSGEDRDDFILSAIALMNLFQTSFFSMKRMERAILSGEINPTIVSPEERIEKLMEIASGTMYMRDQCSEIVSALLEMYSFLYDSSPKEAALIAFLKENHNRKVALIVPKAYYIKIFENTFLNEFQNVVCVTSNRFDMHDKFDIIVATGDIIGKKFDAIQCFSAPDVTLLLYESEEKTFSYRKKRSVKSEHKLNARIKGLIGDEYQNASDPEESNDTEVTEHTMQAFSDLDTFAESIGMFDIRKFTVGNSGGESNTTAEVQFVGTFVSGERILFSKYYSAVVLDRNENTVNEKKPDKLLPGDILVFTKRNDYTSNIVDSIFDRLMQSKKLSVEVQDAAEKSCYWKEALLEYKESNSLTYRSVAKELKKHGSSLQEMTVRQWLNEESHIIGPRDLKTMKIIAQVTQDPYLLKDPEGYFDACRIVRHYRREILLLIAQAVNDRLSNKHPKHGSVFEVVYENIDRLSETLELENIYKLDNTETVNIGMVNRPISESEVLM